MIFDCRPCDAYVGTHKNSGKPLGTLANQELRLWRRKAHAAFDPLWKSGKMGRPAAYRKMRDLMSISADEAHISRFNVDQCQRLVLLLSESKPRMSAPFATKQTNFSLPACDCDVAPWDDCIHTEAALDPAEAEHLRACAG